MSTESRDLQAMAGLPDEAELLRQARMLLPPVDGEPRPGFAARVAANALEQNGQPSLAWLWRWAAGGAVAVASAAALFLAFSPAPKPPGPIEVASNDRFDFIMHVPGGELAVAQQLELYEDLTLVQNADALEDMDVVEVLHELKLEANP